MMARIFCFLAVLIVAGVSELSATSRGAIKLKTVDSKEPIQLYGSSYALVIGIDDYGAGWPKLSNAVADANRVAAALEKRGFEVTRLLNPNKAKLRDGLEEFIFFRGADPEARLFIWFAGHGHTVGGEGYLVPADAPLPKVGWKFRKAAISLRNFGRFMREVRSKHVLAVFDSCFAGTVFNTSRSVPPDTISYVTTLPVRQFISSGEANQEVSDNGQFRRLFLDALSGLEPNADANKDGYLTGTELGLFLSDKVTNLTSRSQTPRYGKLRAVALDRGDFVFELPVRKKSARKMEPISLCSDAKERAAARIWAQRNSDDGPGHERLLELVRDYPGCKTTNLAISQIGKMLERKVARVTPGPKLQAPTYSGSPPPRKKPFLSPVSGRIVSGFGRRADGSRNDGIDIAVPIGVRVRSAEEGTIAYAGNELRGYGNLILIRHPGNWVTAYAHLSRMLVKRGDRVLRGQEIGLTGRTGSVSQPMLHFETRFGAKPYNPTTYLEANAGLEVSGR